MLAMCDSCGIKMMYVTLLNNLYPIHAEEWELANDQCYMHSKSTLFDVSVKIIIEF